jgi:hypothetical protein
MIYQLLELLPHLSELAELHVVDALPLLAHEVVLLTAMAAHGGAPLLQLLPGAADLLALDGLEGL